MKREALSHPLSIVGVLVTTVSAVLFIVLMIAELAGLLENPYAGLVILVAIPALFVMGLVLIPIGAALRRRQLALEGAAADWPVVDFRFPRVRRTALLIAALTAVNISIVLLAGYGTLHWMESPSFCGQVCHTPMHPQFTAWNNGPHARVSCVSCHIGEGAKGFVHAKLNGVRQLVHVATGNIPQPVPPGAEMPEGTQALTCGRCHQPGRSVGDRLRIVREFGDDETNPETTTVLQMHIGASQSSPRAIHWHADPAVRIEYVATDAERKTIPYVRVTDAKGQVKEYVAPDTKDEVIRAGTRRRMDCIDCHNTVGHPIAQTPEAAVDAAIADGRVSRALPFARRESIRLVKADYPTQEAAAHAIEEGLRSFYKSHGDQAAVARTITGAQNVYRGNVFPTMKVTWGTYPTNRGHTTSDGCFRCHDESHMAKDGTTISADCEYCHRQVENAPSTP